MARLPHPLPPLWGACGHTPLLTCSAHPPDLTRAHTAFSVYSIVIVYVLFELCHIAYCNVFKKSFSVFSRVSNCLSFLFVCLRFCEPVTYSKYSEVIESFLSVY